MQGKIIKGIAGFYYVHIVDMGVVECKAKGIFRNRKIKPLVGDNVIIDLIDREKSLGNITDILPRNNSLIRPAVANIDQALIVFSVTKPEPNFNLLSRFLLTMNRQQLDTIICFNKMELVNEQKLDELTDIFANSGCKVIFTSTYENQGIDQVKAILQDKTTVFAGPSGVGKSSITNLIMPDAIAEIGEISEKVGRGKHTTRHSEIFHVTGNTYIMDTPGFTSLYLTELEKEDVRFYFEEFSKYEGKCKYNGCVHVNEPDCAVKEAVNMGNIHKIRYENYLEIYEEIKSQKKY